MKIYIFSFLLIWVSNLEAQSNCSSIDCTNNICPESGSISCDFEINNTNLNSLSPNTIYCLTGNVTIQANIPVGTIIYINSGAVVSTQNVNQFLGEIINCGTFNQGNSSMGGGAAIIKNYGTFNASQNNLTTFDDIFINYNGASLNLPGSWNIEDSEVVNCGIIQQTNSGGAINVKAGSCFINHMQADITLDGNFVIENGAYLDNYGIVTSEKDININSGSNVYNACSLYSYTKITIDGNLVNDALILSDDPSNNFPSSGQEQIQLNSGVLTNNGLVIGGEFLNNATVNGDGGLFHISGVTSNNGIFLGSGDGLNFYDVSNTNNQIFDTGSNGTNVTSNPFTIPSVTDLLGDCGQSVLPITLSRFYIDYNDIIPHILWATEEEINADRFDILQSKDGIVWILIGKIKASNNGNVENHYRFPLTPYEGENYFKLKMVDLDGNFNYSDVITYYNRDNMQILKVFPNPAFANQTLTLQGFKSNKIKLVNLLGKVVFEVYNEDVLKIFYLPKLPGGHYMIVGDNQIVSLILK